MGKGHFFSSVRKQMGRLLLLVNFLMIAWLWLCCAVTWLPCDVFPRLSLVTLSFPVALIINLFFVFLWILAGVRRVWIPLLGILPCWGYVMDYCPLRLKTEEQASGIKVLSWNTHGLGGSECREETLEYLKNSDADIICLQEIYATGSQWPQFLCEMEERGYESNTIQQTTILTRFHILQADTLAFETRSNRGNRYYLQNGSDTLMLINCHLESNCLSVELKEEYIQMIKNHGLEIDSQSSRSLLSLMAQAARYRGNQAKVMRKSVEDNAGKHIVVCGDFNDTPISYPYQTLARIMKNAYRDSGTGFSVSYNEKGFWVRIDHIFFSSEGESHNTFVDHSINTSDHYPIISWIDFAQKRQ